MKRRSVAAYPPMGPKRERPGPAGPDRALPRKAYSRGAHSQEPYSREAWPAHGGPASLSCAWEEYREVPKVLSARMRRAYRPRRQQSLGAQLSLLEYTACRDGTVWPELLAPPVSPKVQCLNWRIR